MADDGDELLARVIGEIQDRINLGESPNPEEYAAKFPQFVDDIRGFIDCATFMEGALIPGGVVPAARPAEEEPRLDLKAFPIRKRLPDIGLGTVYLLRALDADSERELVVLRAWFTPFERDRIERTVRFFAACQVPGVLRIVDQGRLNQVPFVVREHGRGADLETLVALLTAGGGRETFSEVLVRWRRELDYTIPEELSSELRERAATRLAASDRHLREVARVFAGWARILYRAHVEGFIHREITPRALIVAEDGSPRIQGLGLSWSGTGIGPDRMRHWDPQWCAPEICDGTRGPVTWRADVYGLGLCLARLLALSEPLPGVDPELAVVTVGSQGRVLYDGLPEELPAPLVRLLDEATTEDLGRRLSSLETFATRLEGIFGDGPALAEAEAPAPSRGWSLLRRLKRS